MACTVSFVCETFKAARSLLGHLLYALSIRVILVLSLFTSPIAFHSRAVSPGVKAVRVPSITNFGDSITCGWLATPVNGSGNVRSLNGYAALLDKAAGTASSNFCRASDEAADTSRLWTYAHSSPKLSSGELYTILIGTNDAGLCGAYAGCLLNYQQALLASLAWLAVPDVDKVEAQTIQRRTGAWSNDLYGDLGTTQAGATLTFPVRQTIANRKLFIAYRANDFDTGSATVSIDGKPVTTLYTNPANGSPLATKNGTLDTILAVAVPLGAAGLHIVQVRTVSPGYFALLWAGASQGDYAVMPGSPRVLVGGLPRTSNWHTNISIWIYNRLIQNMVDRLRANGLNVQLAPTAHVLNPARDLVDGTHPNNVGHEKLAAAFASVL